MWWDYYNVWRSDLDTEDLTFQGFQKFETVCTVSDLESKFQQTFQYYQFPIGFNSVLSTSLFEYCFGKYVNLKDIKRWKHNFLGEINFFLMENARYLQSLFRDVNKNIHQKGTETVTTDHKNKSGNVSSSKSGSTSDTQSSGISGQDSQGSNNSLGDTLTILNNQTTSTNYLASKNDESYSKGEISQNTESGFSKSHDNNVSLSQANGESLGFGISNDVKNTVGTYSPLEIAKLESSFEYQKWYDELLTIVDTYFLAGFVHDYD